ncbi:exported hypothetical protein [Desulfamplus magnetovallimortis]|uniref:Uncharacterized protein n=1 Tax=Desulfamplus magnetovallimortis TaxID=1246637 RepID=A0A1W1H8S6_9BACT|nr:hypothetical protein [Desulfamplus magnetovallimortis]SLM28834.1 exported hypothetical protein [Desulfamplus magnetovallimortis]
MNTKKCTISFSSFTAKTDSVFKIGGGRNLNQPLLFNRYLTLCAFTLIFFICTTIFAENTLPQVDSLIKKYGTQEIIDFILYKSPANRITVQIKNKLYLNDGRPSPEYISVYSVDHDLKRLKITPQQADRMIKEIIAQKKLAAETKKKEEEEWKQHLASRFDTGTQKFMATVNGLFESTLIEEVTFGNGTGKIEFSKNNGYFGTGDRANIIFAIESTQLFRDVPELKKLIMKIPIFENTHVLDINRNEIETYYGVEFTTYKDNADAWKNEFASQFDLKHLRLKFADQFVRIRK